MKNKASILAGLGQPKFALPPESEEQLWDDAELTEPYAIDDIAEQTPPKPDRSAIIKAALHKAKQGSNHEN